MIIPQGQTRTLSGTINENIQLSSRSTVILTNVTLNGSINGDASTAVQTLGNCLLNGAINCGNLTIGGNTTIGGSVGGPSK